MAYRSKLLRLCVAVLVAAIICSGCWDSIELQRRAMVAGAAVDVNEDGLFVVTFQLIKPLPGKAGGTDARFQNISGVGATISEAENDIDLQITNLLFYASMRILIVSQDAAKPGLSDTLDMFLREREHRETMQFAIARGSASALLTANNLGPIPAYGLAQCIEEQRYLAAVPSVNLLDISNAIRGEGAPFAPLLELHNRGDEKHAMIVGTEVFDGDMPAGTLDFAASRGLVWTLGLVRGGIAPISGRAGESKFTFAITSITSAIKASVTAGVPAVVIEVEVAADVVEATDGTPTGSSQGLAELEVGAADALRLDIDALIAKSKELRLDLLDIGDLIRAYHPREWSKLMKDWPQPLEQMKTDIHIAMSVERTGLIRSVHQPK